MFGLLVLAAAAAGTALYYGGIGKKGAPPEAARPAAPIEVQAVVPVSQSPGLTAPDGSETLAEPIAGAVARVTKKPFGLKVSPGHSPVTPERFSGYHTGVDLETSPGEQAADLPVRALCGGVLALKEYASGYGGVAVQKCRLEGNDVTVVYGHLRLSSVTAAVGSDLRPGEQLGVLGAGYTKETDGERKHLHLSIHKGTAINIRGYVQTEAELKDWIDPLPLLRSAAQ